METSKHNVVLGSVSFIICLFVFIACSFTQITAQQGVKTMACYFQGGKTLNFSASNIDPYLCTHIIMSGGVVSPDGVTTHLPVDMEQLKEIASLKKVNPTLTVMISLSRGFPELVDQPSDSLIMRFALNAVLFCEKLGLNGLDIDWEFPVSSEKGNFVRFIQILSGYLHSSNLLLSIALPSYPLSVEQGYDIDILNKHMDFVTVMTYDFHSYHPMGDNVTGYNSPLYTPEGDHLYASTAASITGLLYSGLSKDKILMGIPTFGRSWTLESADDHKLHSPAVGPGGRSPYTHIPGFYLYSDVCVAKQEGAVSVYDEENIGEYLYNGTTWAAYDSLNTIPPKIQWVYDRALAGVGIWAYQLDDIHNVCGMGEMPLLKLIKDKLSLSHSLLFHSEH